MVGWRCQHIPFNFCCRIVNCGLGQKKNAIKFKFSFGELAIYLHYVLLGKKVIENLLLSFN